MVLASNPKATVTRTERGLVIAGTRITLYQLMDYLHTGHQPQSIRSDFPQITDAQLEAALAYIEANREQVEAEYRDVVATNTATQEYWEERYQENLVQIAARSPQPHQREIRAKLDAWKSQINTTL